MSDLCEVCRESNYKYKCPKCLKKTCCLQCSKDHKLQDSCSGKAHDPTEYITSETLKNEDDENHEMNPLVQRDYNFLTKLKRTVELKKRDGKVKNGRTLNVAHTNNVKRPRLSESQCQRIIRRGVNCLVLPRGMQRSLANKSKWDKPLDLFVWSIEWILLPNNSKGDSTPFVHVSHRIKETDSIVESMGKIIYDKCCDFYQLHADEGQGPETKAERTKSLINSKLNFYTKWFPYNTSSVLDSKKLVALDPLKKSIAELFRNRTVIEFPTIFVAKSESDLPEEYTVFDENELQEAPHEVSPKKSIDNGSEDEPLEESSKPPLLPTIPDPAPLPAKDISDSESDGYDPGVTMDFLAD